MGREERHVHVKVSTDPAKSATFVQAGELVFDEAEWPLIVTARTGGAPSMVEFIEEQGE